MIPANLCILPASWDTRLAWPILYAMSTGLALRSTRRRSSRLVLSSRLLQLSALEWLDILRLPVVSEPWRRSGLSILERSAREDSTRIGKYLALLLRAIWAIPDISTSWDVRILVACKPLLWSRLRGVDHGLSNPLDDRSGQYFYSGPSPRRRLSQNLALSGLMMLVRRWLRRSSTRSRSTALLSELLCTLKWKSFIAGCFSF